MEYKKMCVHGYECNTCMEKKRNEMEIRLWHKK